MVLFVDNDVERETWYKGKENDSDLLSPRCSKRDLGDSYNWGIRGS